GGGKFAQPLDFPADSPGALSLGDANGDGKLDIVTLTDFEASATVLLGKGDGSFLPLAPVSVPPIASSAALVDVNGDGRPDLVPDATALSLLGNGDGSFQARP